MSKTTIRFGLIGCGMIAKLHAGALSGLPGAELAGVCDPVPGRAEAFVLENGGRAYPDTEAMLTDPEVDAVCICTPSGTHAGLAVQAARAGKHIVSEKPVAITQEQLLQVEEACRVSDVKFCCISQLRFSAAYQKIRQAVQDKKFGSFVCGDIYMKYYREPSYYSQSGWRGTRNFTDAHVGICKKLFCFFHAEIVNISDRSRSIYLFENVDQGGLAHMCKMSKIVQTDDAIEVLVNVLKKLGNGDPFVGFVQRAGFFVFQNRSAFFAVNTADQADQKNGKSHIDNFVAWILSPSGLKSWLPVSPAVL